MYGGLPESYPSYLGGLFGREARRGNLSVPCGVWKQVTRRNFLAMAAAAAASSPEWPVSVPVRRVMDTRARCTSAELHRFWWSIWPEAVRDFHACGIQLQTSDAAGEIRRSAADRPIFLGLKPKVLNLVLTDRLPSFWDNGRSLAGVTTIYEGCHLCLLALRFAHVHRVPFLSTNTCVHEILHALLQDIYLGHPKPYQTAGREFRIDSLATGLWLFHNGSAIRKSARAYVGRLAR